MGEGQAPQGGWIVRRFGALFVLAALGFTRCAAPVAEPPADRGGQTAVLIVLDTVRADHVGVVSGRPEVTPNLDRLAEGGAVFTRAYAQAPWTLPSHATMFTGQEPAEHGCHHISLRYDGEHAVLAERFDGAGFHTGGFTNNPWLSSPTGLDRGFDVFVEVFRRSVSLGTFSINRYGDALATGLTDAGGARTVGAVDDWLADLSGEPVFVFVNLVEAHFPFDPPGGGWRGRFHEGAPWTREVRSANQRWVEDSFGGTVQPDVREEVLTLYDEEIAYVDHLLGELIGVLERHGRLDDALVAVTSDHGEAFGDHETDGVRLIDHQLSVYDELLHVPLVLSWPGRVEQGSSCQDPVGLQDLYPLFLGFMGEGDGGPLMAVGSGDAYVPTPEHRPLRASYFPPRVHRSYLEAVLADAELVDRFVGRGFRSVRVDGHKLIKPSDGPAQLYDLHEDPGETEDVAALQPGVVTALTEQLPPTWVEQHQVPADDLLEALQVLGYVELGAATDP